MDAPLSAAPTMTVRTEIDGPVALVMIDRPARRNAVDRETADALSRAFDDFEHNDALSVAVLTGTGRTFCAGADLHAFAQGDGNRLEPEGDGPMGPTRRVLSKPVIAAIEGYAVAGGLELAIWCDLRVAARDAILGVFCRRWGVPLIDGGTVRLPQLVGLGRALDLILTGRAVEADEALRIGLVDRVCKPGRAIDEALALARSIAAFPQACLRADRASTMSGLGVPRDRAMASEFDVGYAVLEEARTGARRFAEGAGRNGRFDD